MGWKVCVVGGGGGDVCVHVNLGMCIKPCVYIIIGKFVFVAYVYM